MSFGRSALDERKAAEQSESTPAEPAAVATDEPQSEVAEVAATE